MPKTKSTASSLSIAKEIPSKPIAPLLGWCGSKYSAPVTRYVLEEFVLHSALFSNSYYIAPFAGALGDAHFIMPERAIFGDTNRQLIDLYEWVQYGYPGQVDNLWSDTNDEYTYASVRARYNASVTLGNTFVDALEMTPASFDKLVSEHAFDAELFTLGMVIGAWSDSRFEAAIALEQCGGSSEDEVTMASFFAALTAQTSMDFIWLNRCGFNSMFRVNNSKGHFNVPIGKNKNGDTNQPGILELEDYSRLYRDWDFAICDYKNIAEAYADVTGEVMEGQFIYCDPLYVKSGKMYTSSKMNYAELADHMVRWHEQGNTVCTSNHDTPEMRTLLDSRGFEITATHFRQSVSAIPKNRKMTPEIFAILRAE